MSKYQKVMEALKVAQDQIKLLLNEPDDQHHLMKLSTELQRQHDYIALITGAGDAGSGPTEKLGPAKTIGGIKIEYKASTKPEDVNPDSIKVTALKAKVESLFETFLNISSEDLVKKYEDTVIRGVAKKAKMKGITKDNPARVTIDFVDEIKAEIRTEQERQEKLHPKNETTVLDPTLEFMDPNEIPE